MKNTKKRSSKFFIIIPLILLVGTAGFFFFDLNKAYGYGPYVPKQEYDTLVVEIDKENYVIGDMITISGSVQEYHQDEVIRIKISNPSGRMALMTTAEVNPDNSFLISVDTSDFKKIGEYKIKSHYGKYSEISEIYFNIEKNSGPIKQSSNLNVPSNVETQEVPISLPDWIRNNAAWWAAEQIDDNTFVSGIQFLIKEGILSMPESSSNPSQAESDEIPPWIKNNADWWSQGLISDDDFIKGIQYLVEQGIIRV